jgi:hypothetical protein
MNLLSTEALFTTRADNWPRTPNYLELSVATKVCTLARLELAELPSVSPINAGV